MDSQPDESLFCARCSRELTPGTGNFFEVHLSAVADPYPPILENSAPQELRQQIQTTLSDLAPLSSHEAAESIALKRILHLCNRCFARWIENPTGP